MALGHSCGGRSVSVVTESAKTSTRIRVGALLLVMQQKHKNNEIQNYENTKMTNYASKDIHTHSGLVLSYQSCNVQHVNTFVTSTCT